MQFLPRSLPRRLCRPLPLLICGVMLALLVPETVKPCGGTPRPPACNRTIWLGKSVPKIVAINPSGGATIEMILLPWVTWSSTCPDPNAATLTLTIRCTSVSTGQSGTIGPLTIPVNVPTTPGAQTLASGTNRAIYTVPNGTFNPNERYICTVVGSYSVTFPSPACCRSPHRQSPGEVMQPCASCRPPVRREPPGCRS